VKKTGKETGNGMKAAFLAAAVLATAGVAFYFGTAVHAAKASGPGSAARGSAERGSAGRRSADPKALYSKALSLPMFFEPNQGQTAPQVKFLARGAGYGLFLTADEAVLELQHPTLSTQHSAVSSQLAARSSSSSVIRMHLDGASASPRVSGASPLPGKSNYFIGNDSSQWHHDIPQFARVQYQAVYPGVDLVYYGNQGQLEYDFRVAPGAQPNQIALRFQGASARIDSGSLILSTADGDVRFNAPIIYQQDGNERQSIAGSFRQLAGNRIGFTIGDYDHSRELVIDPILTYSTYIGGGGESLVKVAISPADWIYVAGSTTSTDFPFPPSPPAPPPYQSTLPGTQNIFIAVINTSPPSEYPEQLVYATYLGGSQTDSLAGIAVDSSSNIYVAGSTTSPNFPTTSNAFQTAATVAANGGFPGTHGFLSAITLNAVNNTYALTYSTYLAGNGADTVTGMAIDTSCSTVESSQAACNAYVTGVTTSTNAPGNGFPANANGYQTQSNAAPGGPQFFASKIYPANSGSQSMLYSTYFGGGNYGATAVVTGGGIAVDPSGTTVNMYFTGATNMLPVAGANSTAPFPILNAQQSCLNQSGQTSSCTNTPTTTTDAFVAKINPNVVSTASLIYSTYLGGSDNDAGLAIAVDTSSNAYVTGSTYSDNWVCLACGLTGFQTVYGGNGDAFIAKIGNQTGTGGVYPLTYFSYLGGSGPDIGQDIKVDSVQAAHVVGTTSSSTDFPSTNNALQAYGGGLSDAFVALISTTLSGTFPGTTPPGDYSTYLGGSGTDQGTGIAVDNIFGAAYVAGTTQSANFPLSTTPLQGTLAGTQDAFVSKIGATSLLVVSVPNTSPSPNPVAAGTQVEFTFNITNNGTDDANFVQFNALGLPTTGLAKTITASVTSGGGASSCNAPQGPTLSCYIPTLAVNAVATVQVDVTPSTPVVTTPISISGNASANGGPVGGSIAQPAANVVDFNMAGVPAYQTINAGDTATFQIVFTPTSSLGYNATITPSQTTSPSMVTATAPSFNPSTVTLSGSGSASTTLSIATVARPVNTGSLLRRGSFYAAWLPTGGLSLVGLGIGAGRKRRRWLAGAVLGLIAGLILLQPGCGSASTSTATPGGTLAGAYIITITGSAGTAASHIQQVTLYVD
jgi:hypothetical protein